MPRPPRHLSPEERALWAKVAATVTPLERRKASLSKPESVRPRTESGVVEALPFFPAEKKGGPSTGSGRTVGDIPASPKPKPRGTTPAPPPDTLDGGWDRRLRRGIIAPDRTIDLHGHTLATAHDALDHALARAVADEVRVLLVVTGKPPKGEEKRRGLIRASIGDWLAHSPHATRIAAVRNAHPRHGGAGALYLILRRKRG